MHLHRLKVLLDLHRILIFVGLSVDWFVHCLAAGTCRKMNNIIDYLDLASLAFSTESLGFESYSLDTHTNLTYMSVYNSHHIWTSCVFKSVQCFFLNSVPMCICYQLSRVPNVRLEFGSSKKVQRYWESCFNIICQNGLRFRTSVYEIVLRLRLFWLNDCENN